MSSTKKSISRKKAASKLIHRRMLFAAGLGLIPVPVLDAASILGVQVLMVRDIARLYKVPFKKHRTQSFIGSLVGSLGTVGIMKSIPGLGSILGGAATSVTAIAATYAIGKVFVQHFDQGGTLLDFDPEKSRKYFQAAFEKGQSEAGKITSDQLDNQFDEEEEDESVKKLKAIIAKAKKEQRERRNRRRWMFFFLILFLLCLAFWNYAINSTPATTIYTDAETLVIDDDDLMNEEANAIEYDIQPTGKITAEEEARIQNFPQVSTEAVISNFLKRKDSKFPKKYALNAIRFVGNSETLGKGALNQLHNIALLMKKYPDLIVNLYGHSMHKGPKFNRQRVGRIRARALKKALLEEGVESSRVTANYLEKTTGTHHGYWGADIVLKVSTVENVIDVSDASTDSDKAGDIFSIFDFFNTENEEKDTDKEDNTHNEEDNTHNEEHNTHNEEDNIIDPPKNMLF